MMLSSFSCICWPSVCLLWRNVYLVLLPIFWLGCCCWFSLILSCMSCSYILDINPLSVASFANIFSHSEGCLFVLFMVSLLCKSFAYFCFYFHYSRRWTHWNLNPNDYVPLNVIHHEYEVIPPHLKCLFFFVYGVRECSNFILLHVAVQFSQHHLLKRLSFPNCTFLTPLL